MQINPAQFKILALGPFTAEPSEIWQDAPLKVDRHNLDAAMATVNIRLFLPLEGDLSPEGGLDFHFDCLKSLHPDGLVARHPYLNQLVQARAFLAESRAQGHPADRIRQGLRQWKSLPPIEIPEAESRPQSAKSRSAVENILDMVAIPTKEHHIDSQRASHDPIDALLQQVLGKLFGHGPFQQIESAWRGLRLLLQRGALQESVSVRIAPVHPENLVDSLEALTPFLINDLPGAVLLDMPFDNSPLAMERLASAAEWAADLMVPLVAWIPPGFLQIDAWQDLSALPFIPHHLEGPEYAKFRKLCASDQGHWICLTCNRFLIRYPYGKENPPRQVSFREPGPLWISPVWAMGGLIAMAMSQTGWPTRFTDRNQFQIQDLALHALPGLPPMVLEALMDRDRLDQFQRAGISPLTGQAGRDHAFVPRAVTTSGRSLAHQLLAAQVTQFVLWCKDNLPAETNPAALETQLRLAFQVFSEQSRPPGFEDVRIKAGLCNDQGRIPVEIVVTPASFVLPSQEPIEMNLDW